MNKRVISLVLFVVLIFNLCANAIPIFAASGDSGVSASVAEAARGDTFTVTVKIPGTEKQVSSITAIVSFNNSVFELTEFTPPSIEGMSLMSSTVSEANEKAMFSANYDSESGEADVTFNGIDISATFKVKDDAAFGSYDFELDSKSAVSGLSEIGLPDPIIKYEDFVNKTATVTIVEASKSATAVSLNKDTLSLEVGSSETLTATLTPEDSTDTVTWTSSADSVATVDENGTVTAVAIGTATITAKANENAYATCAVTVAEAQCPHTNKTEHPAVPSTCVTLGHNLYYTCDDCGMVFKADGVTETTVEAETLTEYGDHVFTEKIEDEAHLASEGDCQTHKTYYYDCANCDTMGTETFESESYGEHQLSEEWTTENGKHFHKCTVSGCTYKADEASCSGGTATCTAQAICEVCEQPYGELAPHDYKTEWNQGDENGHWHDCRNCSAHDEQQAHVPGAEATETEPQTCTICGYVIEPATGHIKHTPDTSRWYYDETKHWHKCVGCDEILDEAEHHGGTATCTAQAICEVCEQPYGELADHVFTEKIEDEAHLASEGDCQNHKTYYYDCANCDTMGTETFESESYGVHQLSEEWTTENGKHFHKCTVSGCTYKADEASCSGGTATCTSPAICEVCEQPYGELAPHDYKTEWNQGDENGHWHDCRNCSAHDEQQAHVPGAETTETEPQTCTICGYVIEPATGHIKHTPDTSRWYYDEAKHWHKCVGCDETLDEAEHIYDDETDATCDICGYERDIEQPHEHTFSEDWTYDETYHWHECTGCGEIADKAEHIASEWIIDKHASADYAGIQHIECTVCGYVLATEVLPAHDNGFDYDAWYMAMLQLYSRKFTITAEAGNGGSISPVGTSKVQYNRNITYTITPDDGYEIENVIVDGKNVGAVSEYTFENVREKHTIHVSFTEVESGDPFDDVSEYDWYYDDVMFVYENGLMIGTSDNKFSPDVSVSRAMLVTVLWRLEGSPVVDTPVEFSDVPADEWYTDAVNWASANGIVNGYGDGTFGASDTITHEQIAAILNRCAVYNGWSENEDGEADDCYTNSDWAETNVYWADVNGMFDGIGSDISDLTKGADRAELAAYLRRFCEKFIAE